MGTLQVGGTTLGVKNTSTNKIDLSNIEVPDAFGGVTDVSSDYTIQQSGFVMFTGEGIRAFKFNGFVFMQWAIVWPTAVADNSTIITIDDSSLYPSHPVVAPATSYEGDTVSAIRCAQNSSNFTFIGKLNLGNSGIHLTANYFYRIS